MYRQRRKRLHRRRRATVAAVSFAVLAIAVGVPTLASANRVGNLLNNLGLGGGGGGTVTGSGGGTATPKAGTPPTYTPPLHGTQPHGQGTDAVVDITPSTTQPLTGDPSKDGEEVVVGDSRGQQNSDGSYSGKVTLLYLLGSPIVQVTSSPGESNNGPFQPLDDGLNQLCSQSGNQICLNVLGMHSSSTSSSSTNSFEALGVDLGGASGLHAHVLDSNGNISSDGTCQTAHGDSNVAKVSAGNQPILDALQGTSDSSACSNGSQSQSNSSTVLKLGGQGLPIPTSGCDNGTPNSNFTPLSPLLSAVCNANDSNGSQTGSPYGVREALTLFALVTGNTALLKVGTAGPESHVVAPGGNNNPPGTNPGGGGTAGAVGQGGNKGGQGGGGKGGGGGAGAGGPAAAAAAPGAGQLAFTGADLLALAMVGGALILGGLALTTAGRRHRQTV